MREVGFHHSEETKRKLSANHYNSKKIRSVSREWLVHQYYDLRNSSCSIAKEVGVKPVTICRAMERMGLKRRGPQEPRWSKEAKERFSASQTGEKNKVWNGGKSYVGAGYVMVRAKGHPSATKLGGYVQEHRLIAEKVLGRYLKPTELVHHINGNIKDNRHCNLVICQDQAYHKLLHKRIRANERQKRIL